MYGYGFSYDYGPGSGFGSAPGNVAQTGIGMLLGILVIFYLLLIGVLVTFYVLQSLSLYKIAKRRGIHHPWLAWLPVGNMWILGSVSDQYQYVVKGQVRNRRKLLLGLMIALYVLMIPFGIGSIISGIQAATGVAGNYIGLGILLMLGIVLYVIMAIVAAVVQYIAFYDLYRSCQPSNATLYLVLSIVVSAAFPIILFLLRNKDEGMPPRRIAPANPVQEEQQSEPEATQEDFADQEIATAEDFADVQVPAEETVEPAEEQPEE